jgi:hypothetical protein
VRVRWRLTRTGTWLVSAATSATTARREQRDGNNGRDDQHDHDPGSRAVKDSVLFHIW